MRAFTDDEVRAARLTSLLLDRPDPVTPLEVSRWFGAMQAQDVASGHWSLGVRCAGATEAEIVAAFERRELVRTWPMRGTIHVVPAVDAQWLLELTGVRALAGAAARRERLGLTLADTERANSALDAALADDRVLTRAQAVDTIAAAGVDPSGQRGYHLLWFAAQTGVVCIGPQRGSDQTFVRLRDWVRTPRRLDRDDALAELAFRYMRSHGPVGLPEFSGWSGLTMADVRRSMAVNDGRITRVRTQSGDMWATVELIEAIDDGRGPSPRTATTGPSVVVLPGFDEFLLGYKDRTLHVPAGAMAAIIPGGNGVFRATVVVDGVVAATWTRAANSRGITVTVQPLRAFTSAERAAAHASFDRYAGFLGRDVSVTFAG